MRTLYRSVLLPLVLIGLHPLSAFAWTNYINCEGGSPGALVGGGGTGQFTDPFSLTTYSTAEAANGKQSCNMAITAGSDGWGLFGATYNFPANVARGSAVWVRVSVWMPASFPISTNDGYLKFMRVHTANASGGNDGYHDLLFTNPGFANSPFVYNFEGHPGLVPVGTVPTNNPVRGTWETYEMYVMLDSTAKSAGGQGEVRIWKNNTLLLDLTSQPTLVTSASYANAFFLFTYWNGNAPSNANIYVDDITVTSDTPSNRDAKGNPCICGPQPGSGGGGTASAVPDAPTLTVN